MIIGKIIEGHVNELLGLNKDISEERLKICKKCPLYSFQFGGICNSRLYINLDNEDVSIEPKPGYKHGCGCRLKAKTAITNEQCPINKW